MRWLSLSGLVLCLSCTAPTSYQVLRDPPDYVDHIIEDVTAMLQGMAAAHATDRVVLRDPNFRSGLAPR